MPATATSDELLTLPTASMRVGYSPEFARKRLARDRRLDAVVRRVGPIRVVYVRDLERLKQLLGAGAKAG